MKKIFAFAAVLMMSVAAMAQQPVITFERVDHDFGKINEADGRVTTVFAFKNEGMAPLVLSNVRASCGCTTPKWTREPIEPGQTGEITVTYNPAGRPGRFQTTITVTSNASEATKKLTIRGEVIPKSATPVDEYPIKMGNLSMKVNRADFGAYKKGSSNVIAIEYANKSQEVVTVALLPGAGIDFAIAELSMTELKPNETGRLSIGVDNKLAAGCYGPYSGKVYMVVNGKKEISDTYAVFVNVDFVEDFSRLTQEQLMKAPIAECNAVINLGTIAAGKKAKGAINLSNAGADPLMVRRVFCDDKSLVVTSTPKSLKSGKKGDIKFEINALGLKPGQYKREVLVITNDPKNPVRRITLTWIVG